ncbi:hypothetical protein PCV68_001023 [Staphylococcus pseudintermedius]|nr:hypothetical protein [Staphylococcus pseudintermedius]
MDNNEYYIRFKGSDLHNDRTNYINWNYDDGTYFMASKTGNYFFQTTFTKEQISSYGLQHIVSNKLFELVEAIK